MEMHGSPPRSLVRARVRRARSYHSLFLPLVTNSRASFILLHPLLVRPAAAGREGRAAEPDRRGMMGGCDVRCGTAAQSDTSDGQTDRQCGICVSERGQVGLLSRYERYERQDSFCAYVENEL